MEKIHPETGKILHRDIKPIEYTYKGESIIINQPGWYPDDDSDGIFTSKDWDIADKAIEILKSRYESKISQHNFETGNIVLA